MDQRQKQVEAELATLRAEKEAAIQERWDHTINQDRLAKTSVKIWKRNMPIKNKTTLGN